MYRQEDFDGIKKQFTRIMTLMVAGLIFFIVISIVIANKIENWAGMIFLLVGICVEIFVWVYILLLSFHIIALSGIW